MVTDRIEETHEKKNTNIAQMCILSGILLWNERNYMNVSIDAGQLTTN